MKELMSSEIAVIPLFATPFAAVPLGITPETNAELARLLAARATEAYIDPSARRDPLCFRSREDFLDWDEAPVRELRDRMISGICGAVLASSLSTEAEFDALRVQARARFVLVRPNGCVPVATIPMTSWAAVYCVAAPPVAPARRDSGALRVYALRHTMFMDAANWNLRPPFAGGHYLWQPEPGHMAVFPASILHEIALNRSSSDLVLVMARVRFAHPSQTGTPPW